MNPREIFKIRPSINEARDGVVEFFKELKLITVAVNSGDKLPKIDVMDYFYFKDQHIGIVPPMSSLKGIINDQSEFRGFVQNGLGKMATRFTSDFTCKKIDSESQIIEDLAVFEPRVNKLRSHGAAFVNLNMSNAIILFSDSEIYNIDNDLNPSFAKFGPSGRERFEHSRKVLMEYLDRSVIFNCYIEDGVYHTLTKVESNKMEHIKNGGVCKIFDGRDNHFETVINIISDRTDEIFEKLNKTNNSYFKQNEGLTALSFKKTK